LPFTDVHARTGTGGGPEDSERSSPPRAGSAVKVFKPVENGFGRRLWPPSRTPGSGLCHGKTNADWEGPRGFGAETLRRWVARTKPEQARARRLGPHRRGVGLLGHRAGRSSRLRRCGEEHAPSRRKKRLGHGGDPADRPGGLPAGIQQQPGDPSKPIHPTQRTTASKTASIRRSKRGQAYPRLYSGPFQEIAAIFKRLRREARE